MIKPFVPVSDLQYRVVAPSWIGLGIEPDPTFLTKEHE
jgi:hypothetical protein